MYIVFLSSPTSSIELAQDSGVDSIVVTGDFKAAPWDDINFRF